MRNIPFILLFLIPSYLLGCESEDSVFADMKKNKDISTETLIKSEEQTLLDQVNIGLRYIYSKRYEHDIEEGIKWLKKASEKGCNFATAELGILYFSGKQVEKDYTKALYYWNQVVGFSALVDVGIGEIYAKGLGVEEDPKRALEYFLSEKSLDVPEGAFWVGVIYYSWEGIEHDNEKAFKYFKMAADMGHEIAEFYVGHALHFGIGVEKNIDEALRWYKKSANKGYTLAKIYSAIAENGDEEVEIRDKELIMEFLKEVGEGNI